MRQYKCWKECRCGTYVPRPTQVYGGYQKRSTLPATAADIGGGHATSKQCQNTTSAVNLSQSKATNAIRIATLSGVLCFRTKGTRISADGGPREGGIVLITESHRRQHGQSETMLIPECLEAEESEGVPQSGSLGAVVATLWAVAQRVATQHCGSQYRRCGSSST